MQYIHEVLHHDLHLHVIFILHNVLKVYKNLHVNAHDIVFKKRCKTTIYIHKWGPCPQLLTQYFENRSGHKLGT